MTVAKMMDVPIVSVSFTYVVCICIYDEKLITMNTCNPTALLYSCKNKRTNEEVIHVMTSGA